MEVVSNPEFLAQGTAVRDTLHAKALHWLANYHDYELKTIKATIEVNVNQKIKLMKKPIIIDGRNCFKLEDVKNHNIVYESIGRKAIANI